MKRIDLAGIWSLYELGSPESVPAAVPGDNITALVAAGRIPDPYVGTNEKKAQWVRERTWVWQRDVTVSDSLLAERSVYLSFDSLDTIAEVRVNDVTARRSDNMFVRQRFEVRPLLRPGKNRIAVVCHPIDPVIRERWDALRVALPWNPSPFESIEHINVLRKVQCHGGWDWGPCLPVSGIYQEAWLGACSLCRIDYVTTVQHHEPGRCTLDVEVHVLGVASGRTTLEVSLGEARATKDVAIAVGDQIVSTTIAIDTPRLWWPAGQGEQPLYELSVRLGDEVVTKRIGLRTIEIVTEDGPEPGEQGLVVRVNGRDVFCKGANWIPADALPAKQTRATYAELLDDAVRANMNMLRVWGGGQYEPEVFYDLCDEKGLLVWHDLMFACHLYPSDAWFLASIREEARHQVRRLRDHACIALFCGDNEVMSALGWHKTTREALELYAATYDRVNRTLGEAVAEADPTRTFWPSSPCDGPNQLRKDCSTEKRGDAHYWTVWHGRRPFEAVREFPARFASEFGFQSLPAMELIRAFAPPDQHNPTSPVMEFHQRSPAGNTHIPEMIAHYFRIPNGFESFVWASRLLQALGIKTMVEHWRTLRPHCMGTLYWQLNDVWPVASWSSIDHGGKWKPLHYMARRFYAPLLATVVEHRGVPSIWVVSDEPGPAVGELRVRTVDLEGRVVAEDRHAVRMDGSGARKVADIDVARLPCSPDACLLELSLLVGDRSCQNHHLFERPKRYELAHANVKAELRGRQLLLTTDRPALYVTVDAVGIRGEWSDNAFVLLPGEGRTLTFEAKGPLDEVAFARSIDVRHLRMSY